MSGQQLQELIQRGWEMAAHPRHLLEMHRGTDPEGREHLLIVVNGQSHLRIYPLSKSWTRVEGYFSWVDLDRFHYSANYDNPKSIAIEVIGILVAQLLRTQLE
jgi:hypothetical protein